MNTSNVFQLADSLSQYDVRHLGKRSAAGIYGLVDVERPDVVRYVGSSGNIAHRLYSHWHSPTSKRTPVGLWLRAMRVAGCEIAALMLEACDPGPKQSHVRMAKEGAHIARLHPLGQADLNVSLVPMGHPNSEDSYAKGMRAELLALRAENEELRRRLAAAEMA